MPEIKSYYEQLRFDPSLRTSFIARYLTNIRLVMLLIISILVVGVASFALLPRRLNPEVEIPLVIVSTALPGASPEEVESLITIPLENEIQNADGLDLLSSTSQESVSVITAQFKSHVTVDDAREEIRRLVDTVNDLPEEANEPTVQTLDFEDVAIWEFAITTDDDRASLETLARQLEDRIEGVSNVDRVVVNGVEQKQIQILVPPEKIAELGLNQLQLSGAIQAALKSLPAGSVVGDNTDFVVSVDQSVAEVQDLRTLPINLNGQLYQLQDFATISYRNQPYQSRSYLITPDGANGPQPAVRLSVYKTSGSDISTVQRAVQAEVETFLKPYQETGTVEFYPLENVARDIEKQFGDLFGNFTSTIALVFLTLFIFLGIRQASIASISIPLTFLVSFAIMQATGQTLNFLSLFSLLLALGLMVDDAIVVVEATTAYFRTGKFTAEETGLLVWRDYIVPIWTTTITTVWAFLPLLLATGIIGEFISSIPVVVSAALLTSTAVAVLINLPLMMLLLDFKMPQRIKSLFLVILAMALFAGLGAVTITLAGPVWIPAILSIAGLWLWLVWRWRVMLVTPFKDWRRHPRFMQTESLIKKVSDQGIFSMQPVVNRYQSFIHRVITKQRTRRTVLAGVVIFSIFSYALVPLGFVRNEFFPDTDANVLYVGMELASGTSLQKTEHLTLELLEKVKTVPELVVAQADVGVAPISADGSGGASGTNQARITLRLTDMDDRQLTVHQLAEQLRRDLAEFGQKNNVTITVSSPSGGPPAGSDVSIKIKGPQLSQLQQVGDQLVAYLEEKDSTINITRSIKPGPSKIVFEPNLDRLADYGLSNQEVGLALRTAISGFKLGEITLPGDKEATDIDLHLYDRPVRPEELSQLVMTTPQGPVPVVSLGDLALAANPTQISREDGQRTLTINAEVPEGYSVSIANQEALEFANTLELPPGYSFDTGGVNEENQKSVNSILQAMVLAVLLILATMVVQLGSFRQALLVVLVIPLAVSGVFVVFALTGTPLSFPALIGVLALFGIVVNNSIMLVDKINQNINIGMKQAIAVSDAASNRLEPILFSSLTTITGLIPITITDPLWRGLGGGIISGLMLSGAIMLLFIPVMYVMWYPEK